MQLITRNRMSGFSLVELMVALGISVLLLMGVVALFVSSRASYETTERLSRIQENGRFALEQLASDIRSSSFNACARGATPTRMNDYRLNATVAPFPPLEEEDEENPIDMRWDFAKPMLGFDTTNEAWVPELNAELLNPEPSLLGDVLVLRLPRREVRAVQVTMDQDLSTDPLQVNVIDPMPIEIGDTVMISDCAARAFFQVTNDPEESGQIEHGQVASTTVDGVARPGNVSNDLLHPFKAGATIVPISSVIYYLAESRNQPEQPPGVEDPPPPRLSLYRKTGGGQMSDEIAEGIERFEVQYGIDNDGSLDGRVDTYVSAADVEDWNLVMAVQVALLSRAPDEYGTDIDRQTYVLLTAPEEVRAGPYNDRAQRKVFTATLAVRNQIID